MQIQYTLLRGKLARQLLILFVVCALIPMGILSALSYYLVTSQLYEQSEDRLRRSSKAAGMALLARVQSIDDSLAVLPPDPADEAVGSIATTLEDRVSALSVFQGSDATHLLGGDQELPTLGPAGERHLEAGKAVLVTLETESGVRALLARRLPATGALAVAEIDPRFLLEVARDYSLPTNSELCIFDQAFHAVGCTLAGPISLPESTRAAAMRTTTGQFEWRLGDETYLVGRWALFLKPNFLHREWHVMILEPKEAVLAPIAGFRTIFPLTSALALLLVSFVSLREIRRRLIPLEKLRDGTRQIAKRRFDVEVAVGSGDEFEELAHSFNTMAAELGLHFSSLSKLVEVDRAILAAAEAESIGRVTAAGIANLYPGDIAAVALTSARTPESVEWIVAHGGTRTVCVGSRPFPSETMAALQPERAGNVIDLRHGAADDLEPLVAAGARYALVLPLVAQGGFRGFAYLGRQAAFDCDAEELVYVRQICDQAAIALSNAHALEENRTLAYYDSLTDLPNRLLFKERLGQALIRAQRHQHYVAICLIDLDGFKRINDTLGHDAGDQLLKQVAARVSRASRSGAAARLGGDEFTILLTELDNAEDAARVTRRLLEDLSKPFRLGIHEVFVTGSIGISVYPDDGQQVDTLLKNADVAMYHAKDSGRNNFQFFSSSMNEASLQRLQLEQDLRTALERDGLELFYQPIVDVRTRCVLGGEALLRWRHPRLGVLRPDDFVPMAEETGLIVQAGEWVIRRACHEARVWESVHGAALRIAVNLSPRQFREPGLIDTIRTALCESGLSPSRLCVEITENLLMSGDARTVGMLSDLNSLGVQISVDDFGIGYSSLGYLKHFPVDVLKIDRSFIRDIETDSADVAIVTAIIDLAHRLSMEVVAEGVETEGQLQILRHRRCDAAQGFLFARPLPSDDFAKRVADPTG